MSFNKYRLKGAYHYGWYETEDWYKWLVDRCVKFCGRDVIDVGCGDGLLMQKLHDNGQSVIGIDNDPDAIRLCEQRGFWVSRVDLDKEDFVTEMKDRDYMTCLNVIEHLKKPEILKDMIRYKINDGAIIATIDYQGGSFGEDHKKEYTLDELVDFFKEFNPKPFRYKNTEWIGVEIRK